MSNKALSQYKEGEKKEEYHKLYLNEILNDCLDETTPRKTLMARCYEYFHGTQSNPMNQLNAIFDINGTRTNPQERLSIPVINMKVNKIKPKIQTLIGDLIDLGFESSVEAINEEAKTAKLQYQNEILGLLSIQDKISEIDRLLGIENTNLPASEQEFMDFMKREYKENSEVVMEACLNYSLQYNSYLMLRLQMFLDVVVAGEAHGRTFMQKGFPLIERLNPLNIYYPRNVNDNEYLDKTYKIVNVYYAPIQEVIEKYNLTEQEVKEDLEAAKGSSIQGAWYGLSISGNMLFTPYDRNNKNLVLVAEGEWMDSKPERVTVAKHKDGIEDVIIRYGEDAEKYKVNKNRWEKKGKTLVEDATKVVTNLRRCTRIGCNIIKEWGEVEGTPLSPVSWATVERTITSYRPYYTQGDSQSTVMDVMNLQDFIEYIYTKLQLEITKSSGKVLVINLKNIPKQFGANPQEAISKVLHYLKGYNIVFRDAEQEDLGSTPSNGLPVDEVDMGLSTAVNAFFQLLSLTNTEIDAITGLNEARMGEIANNQLASVTSMMLNQSGKQTKHMISGFLRFEDRLLSKHLQQIKYSWWMYPKAWGAAIGDVYYAFLEATRDISLDTHMVRVKNDTINRQTLQQYIFASLQGGHMQPDEALAIELTAQDSIKEAVRKYIDKMERQREEAKAMQEQQMAMQQQMMQEQAAAKQAEIAQVGQNQLADRKLKGEFDLQKQAMRDQTDREKQAMQQANQAIGGVI